MFCQSSRCIASGKGAIHAIFACSRDWGFCSEARKQINPTCQWEKRFVWPIGTTIFSGICWLCNAHSDERSVLSMLSAARACVPAMHQQLELVAPISWLILVFPSESQEIWCQHISPTRIYNLITPESTHCLKHAGFAFKQE